MNVQFSEEIIQAALNNAAERAIQSAFSSYSIGRVMEEQVGATLIKGVLSEAVESAVNLLDVKALATVLANELSRNVIKGVTYLLQSSVIDILIRLDGIAHYETKKLEERRVYYEARIFGQLSKEPPAAIVPAATTVLPLPVDIPIYSGTTGMQLPNSSADESAESLFRDATNPDDVTLLPDDEQKF